jgi:hypothetical protein
MKKLWSLLIAGSILFVVACEKEAEGTFLPPPNDKTCELVELATVVPFEKTDITYEFNYGEDGQVTAIDAWTNHEDVYGPIHDRWMFAYNNEQVSTVVHYRDGKMENEYVFVYVGNELQKIQSEGNNGAMLVPIFEDGQLVQLVRAAWNPWKKAYLEKSRIYLEWMEGNLMRYTFRSSEKDEAIRFIYDKNPAPKLPLEVVLVTDMYTFLSENNVVSYFAYDPPPYYSQVKVAYEYDYNADGYPNRATLVGDGRDVIYLYRCDRR